MIDGDDDVVAVASRVLDELGRLIARGFPFKSRDIQTAIRVVTETPQVPLGSFFTNSEVATAPNRAVRAQAPNQKLYIEAIRAHDLVFAVGPAGTGKTYLAMAVAIEALNDRAVRRIILARPAIEAGERLGFLPGDMYEKVNPYLRPLYDALHSFVDVERANRLLERGAIEIAPIAFMRGRTLSDSFVILDEAQNTTVEQMKMFLTRIGLNTKVVVNGDITQVDLQPGRRSGLIDAVEVLRKIDSIAFIRFDERDVVRHPLVKRIVAAYDRNQEGRRERPGHRGGVTADNGEP